MEDEIGFEFILEALRCETWGFFVLKKLIALKINNLQFIFNKCLQIKIIVVSLFQEIQIKKNEKFN